VVLDFNIHPRARNLGSAIFMHIMHDDAFPTAGCIALERAHLQRLLTASARERASSCGRWPGHEPVGSHKFAVH
jgi:L,D-peptidoglycan transpeptidase YkuD (ErfK/YbiS/YcfS/YnhG family)